MQKPKVIAVVGPTGSGKSALGKFLASKLTGEIVSADSRQIYKGMRVLSRAERGHMISVADPKKVYSVGEYVRDAKKSIDTMIYHSKTPVVVGGTGLYADALLRGWQLPEVAPNKKLRAALAKKSPPQLYTMLRKIDPVSAKRVDRHNPVRLVRAIEIAQALGKVPALRQEPPFEVLWLGLKKQKNLRVGVEARLKAGMATEAKRLRAALPRQRYLELGFEFVLLADYLDKKLSKKELVEKLVHGEEEYARRQWRWFKRHKDIHWVVGKTEALRLSKKFLSSS